MKKYWYYTYKVQDKKGNIRIGFGTLSTDGGEFPISYLLESLQKALKTDNVVFDSWHEISTEQYEKMQKFFDKTNK